MPQPNFPDSPTVNQEYTYSGSTWVWTGQYWRVQQAPSTNNNFIPAANVTYDLGSANQRWRDLYLAGNTMYIGGATITATGSAIALPAGSTVGGQNVASGSDVATGSGPKITNVQVTSNSYVVLDDTAVDIAGGYIKITGTGFAAGCQVLINNTPATSTTFIGPTEVRAQLPASVAGTYMLYLINSDGGVAIRVNGVTFSATPSWVTASDLTSYGLGDAISIQLAATGASTFALAAGSTLPTGLTLSAGGLLSGSVTGLENDTSYSFTITATDAENQDSPRTFTITITVQLQVSRSLRFNSADQAYLIRTPAVAGNRRTWTFSSWIKKTVNATECKLFGSAATVSDHAYVMFGDGAYTDNLSVAYFNGSTHVWRLITTQVFRDTSAWYHLVVAFDSTSATSTDRVKIYINGSQITTFQVRVDPAQNVETYFNSTNAHYLGTQSSQITTSFNGYITEAYLIDGQALTPSAFAETNNSTGQYIPKKYTGTYGTNGFYLPFTDNSSVANLGRNYQPLTADPFWPQTVLLLNGTGTNNANNNTFIDSSTNAFAITRSGNATQGTFSPFSLGGYSYFFGDSSTNSKLTAASNAAFAIGTGNFTVEFFINFTAWASTEQRFFGQSVSGTNGLVLGRTVGTEAIILNTANGTGSNTIITYTWTPVLGRWYHMAVVRSGTGSNQVALYIDGTVVATGTSSDNIAQNQFVVGSGWGDGYSLRGYLSRFRYSNVARTISIPTQDLTSDANTLLLTAQRNRFVDQSSYAHTLTIGTTPSVSPFSPFTANVAYSAATNGGSAYFDGTGDWVNPSTTSANLALGSGDFTIEFWLNTSRGATRQYIFDFRNNGSTASITPATAPIIIWGDDGADGNGNWLRYAGISNGSVVANADLLGVTLSTLSNQWNHIAIVRSSGTVYGYLNGLRKNSVADSTNYNVNCSVSIAAAFNGGANYLGNISDFRVVKGTAVYTGTTYTVPTAPVTAVANTSLLLNFTNAAIVDATGDNNIETVGDAKISTAQSKWAGSSMLFDGTGDWLQLPASDVYAFGSGDYTVEAWVYFTSINNTNLQIIFGSGAAGGNSFFFSVDVDQISVGTSAAYISNQATTFTTGQWYHVVACRSGTTLRLFVNGTQAGSNVTDTTNWTSSGNARVGANSIGTQTVFGYIQDLRITRAARYTGNFTPPTAQFAYNQGDINYNQWVPTNFSVTAGAGNDSVVDSPTNWGVDTGLGGEVRGNYCTWNPLNATSAATANGNLEATLSGNAGLSGQIRGSLANLSGKWYWESVVTADGNQSHWIGVIGASSRYDIRLDNSNTLNQVLYARYDGQKIVNGTISAYGASYIVGDVIGIALDLDIGIVTFYKNNVSQGAISLPTTGIAYTPVFWYSTTATSGTIASNFGQRPFAYAAPSGFKALNTHNLPALAVAKSNTAFDTVLYTGTGTARTITGFNFGPDFVWVKQRSGAATAHSLQDIVRGTDKHLTSNGTDVEANSAAYGGGITAFTGNGFSTGTWGAVNENTQTYVAWAWDAGTTTVVNTAGTIQSNVRVNAAAGISIATFATLAGGGGTFGHGLGVAPKFIIQKSRTGAQDWYVYHASLGASAYMLLNSSAASVSSTAVWGGTTPSSAIVTLGSGWTNNNHGNVVAYCFAEVPGFSAFGTYTGNSSTDGPFVHTGFRPAFVMIKSYSGAFDQAYASWTIHDNKRNPTNKATDPLFPNLSAAEGARGNGSSQPNVLDIDILSNGFKIRASATESNYGSYIYAAFAESPFKYARAR